MGSNLPHDMSQHLGQVPVVHGDMRLDASRKQGVYDRAVKIQAELVHVAITTGENARPGDGDAQVLRAQLLHDRNVPGVQMVKVVRNGTCMRDMLLVSALHACHSLESIMLLQAPHSLVSLS